MDQPLTMAAHMFRLTCLVTLYLTALVPVQAQHSPTMTVSSTDNLNGVNTGESIAINCTITVPEGTLIGWPLPNIIPVSVIWGQHPNQARTSNSTVILPEKYTRLSVLYFQDGIDHTYQLTISDVQLTDSDTYFCQAYVSVSGDFSSTEILNELVHVSIGDRLYEDKPHCNIDPGNTILDGQTFTPTCILKRGDTSLTVDWTLQNPNGTFKEANYQTTIIEGLNFVTYALNLYKKGSVLDNGLTFFCSVTTSNKNCSVELSIVAGPEVSGNNLIGANIGDTMTMTATMTFPKDFGFWVSQATWRRLLTDDDGFKNIITDNVIRDDRVDPTRFSVQISESNDKTYTNTVTITDAKESDSGTYTNTLYLAPIGETGKDHYFSNSWSVAVGYDFPYCSTSPKDLSTDDEFIANCKAKKGNSTIDMTWTRQPPDNMVSLPRSYRQDEVNYIRLFTDVLRYSDYIGSSLICTITSPDLPRVVNSCTLEFFPELTTTGIPTTTMKPDQGGLTTTQSSTSTTPRVEYSSTHMSSTTMLSTLTTTSSMSPMVSSEMMTKPDKSTPTKKSGRTGRSASVAVGITIPIVVIIIIILLIILIMLYKRHSAKVKTSGRISQDNVGMAPVANNGVKA